MISMRNWQTEMVKSILLIGWLVGLEFKDPVNTIQDISSQTIYLTTLFLGMLNQYLCTFFLQELTTALFKSVEGKMTVKSISS